MSTTVKTADELKVDADAMRVQHEAGRASAADVIDAYRVALRAMERERDHHEEIAYDYANAEAEALADARGHLADLSKIADGVLDLERGIMTVDELVALVRRIR